MTELRIALQVGENSVEFREWVLARLGSLPRPLLRCMLRLKAYYRRSRL
jgi:hypothetical protein